MIREGSAKPKFRHFQVIKATRVPGKERLDTGLIWLPL
jgi:hypothetical protein